MVDAEIGPNLLIKANKHPHFQALSALGSDLILIDRPEFTWSQAPISMSQRVVNVLSSLGELYTSAYFRWRSPQYATSN